MLPLLLMHSYSLVAVEGSETEADFLRLALVAVLGEMVESPMPWKNNPESLVFALVVEAVRFVGSSDRSRAVVAVPQPTGCSLNQLPGEVKSSYLVLALEAVNVHWRQNCS